MKAASIESGHTQAPSVAGMLWSVTRHAIAAAVLFLVVAPWAWVLRGVEGLAAPALAATVCLVGAASGAMTAYLFRRHLDPFGWMTLGMLLRMAVSLAACLAVLAMRSSGPLSGVGFPLYVVLFYLASLAVEVQHLTSGVTGS